jgi:hypothetical protein
VATQDGTQGTSKSDGDIGVATALKKIEHSADLAARDAYWSAVSTALGERSSALSQLDSDALDGAISTDPLKSIGLRAVRFKNIVDTYESALSAAKAARTATEGADFQAFALALDATKTALILQGVSQN